MITDEYIDEEYEGLGKETDDWMDVKEATEFIDMSDSPGDIVVKFTGKPILQRSKFGGKKQYWFPVSQLIDIQKDVWDDRTLSTGSTKLRRAIKRIYEKDSSLFNGEIAVGISWTGKGMDRSYTASRVVLVGDPE